MELYNSLITEAKGYYGHLPQKLRDYDPSGLWPSNESSELVLQKDGRVVYTDWEERSR